MASSRELKGPTRDEREGHSNRISFFARVRRDSLLRSSPKRCLGGKEKPLAFKKSIISFLNSACSLLATSLALQAKYLSRSISGNFPLLLSAFTSAYSCKT